MVVSDLAGAARAFCGVSCPKAGEIGPPTSVTARIAANNGRADSVFIVLLTLEILSPRGLNLILLIFVKRSQNGICFTPRPFLEYYLESTVLRSHTHLASPAIAGCLARAKRNQESSRGPGSLTT